jgi:hypothetical protein
MNYTLKGTVIDVRGCDIYFLVKDIGVYTFLLPTPEEARKLMDKEVEVVLTEIAN